MAMTNPKFFGIRRGIASTETARQDRHSNLPLGSTTLPAGVASGKEMLAVVGKGRARNDGGGGGVAGAAGASLGGAAASSSLLMLPEQMAATAPANMLGGATAAGLKFDPHAFLLRSSRVELGHKGVVQHTLKTEARARGLPAPARGLAVPKPSPFVRKGPAPTNFDKPRSNPPNSLLRMTYERGDLPCVIIQKGAHNNLTFSVPVGDLDYSFYLPIFFSGLREEEHPLPFLAEEGIRALLAAAPEKVLAVIPQCIIPLREALNTRRRAVVVRAILALERLATCDVHLPPAAGREGAPKCAQALVPYFRQLLPVINIFAGRNITTMDIPDYGQRKNRVIGERVDSLLLALETYGGPDAFVNIRYMVPTYTSAKLLG